MTLPVQTTLGISGCQFGAAWHWRLADIFDIDTMQKTSLLPPIACSFCTLQGKKLWQDCDFLLIKLLINTNGQPELYLLYNFMSNWVTPPPSMERKKILQIEVAC